MTIEYVFPGIRVSLEMPTRFLYEGEMTTLSVVLNTAVSADVMVQIQPASKHLVGLSAISSKSSTPGDVIDMLEILRIAIHLLHCCM